MPAPKKPLSLRELATICGLSVSAVSYALHNSPHVSEATRKLVAKKAREHNYQQDGRLSELMTHLRTRRDVREREIIGVLHDGFEGKEPWKVLPAITGFHSNIVRRAEELGYSIASFPLAQPGMSAARLTKILLARGIRGLIIAPPSLAARTKLEIDTKHFAIAQCLHSIWEPNLPRVEPHHFENTIEAIHNLRALGYRSAGLVLPGDDPLTTSHLIEAACHFVEKNRLMRFVPIFAKPGEPEASELRKWLDKHRPEVVISYMPRPAQFLREAGIRVPEQVGVCHMGVTDTTTSGIDFLAPQIDSTVVDLVVEQLRHNQLGVPPNPKVVFIRGCWRKGETLQELRPQSASDVSRTSARGSKRMAK